MRVNIENYRGILHADFTVDGITLVAAPNASGKTSIAQAVSAALNANPLPVPGMTKTMAGFLVRSGATGGFSLVANDNDPDADDQQLSRIDWPKAVVSTEGAIPPSASPIATGAESIVDMDKTKRTAFLMELLDGAPKKDQLAKELKKVGITKDEHVDKLWSLITEIGWDNAHSQTKDKGAKLKGQWEMITGDRYGSKKAETFMPAHWDPELDGTSEEALQLSLAKHKESLEAVIAADAVDHARRAEHQERADKADEIAELVAELEDEVSKADGALAAAHAELSNNPAPVAGPQTVACPCCNERLIIRGRTLEKASDAPDEEAMAAAAEAHKAARAEVDRCNQALHAARDNLRDAHNQQRAALSSAEWLKQHADDEKPKAEINIDLARENVANAERLLTSWKTKADADRIHENIEKNQSILDILAPGGLRQTVLTNKTRTFVDEAITPLTKLAKWDDISFDRDLTISYGGRIYALLSESEKFRVRVALQVAIAKLQRAPMVVVDAADILDDDGRAGLMRMLHGSGMRSLVCMTYQAVGKLPNLSKLKGGQVVWINGGRAEPISQQ